MAGAASHGRLALLVEDPDLALGVPEPERAAAERSVSVQRIDAEPGPIDLRTLVEEPQLGVLVLTGFVGISVAIGDRAVEQILGPGDVLQAFDGVRDTVPATFEHRVVERARLAVLDARFIAAARRWPGLLLALHERLHRQERQLFIHAAASKQRRAEDRVLAALWQLAEQWGTVTGAGVVLPLPTTHALLGRLSGASRPTISLALAALAERGQLRRTAGGRFVLAPDSWRLLDPDGPAPAPLPAPPPQPVVESPTTAAGRQRKLDRDALLTRVEALQNGFGGRVRDVDELLATSRTISERSAEVRTRMREARLSAAADPPRDA